MIWLFLLLCFLRLGMVMPVLGQETAGTLIKYKDGRIVELVNSQKMVTTMSSGEGGEEDNILYTQPNYKYIQYEISDNDKKWFLDNTGQEFINKNGMSICGKSGADVSLKKANEILNGATKQPVVVAIIDSGVDYKHPFLVDKMWDGSNCVDELGNKLGGCINGYDFGDKDKDPIPNSDLPEEQAYHGTHIAGIVAMMADNVKIMALKCNFNSGEIARAIEFAQKNGAKIINASFGTEYKDGSGYPIVSDRAMYEAIADFDGVFVNAAGNDGVDIDCGLTSCMPFPAILKNKTELGDGLRNIMVVGAVDYYDDLAYFSNYGKSTVDLGAAGVDIYSTIGNSSYRYYSGTSMATPVVVGGMAYVWGWKNNLNRDQIMDYTINSGQKLESLMGIVKSGKRLDLAAYTALIDDEEGVIIREGNAGKQVSLYIDVQGVPTFLYNHGEAVEFFRDGKTKIIEKTKSILAMAKDKNDYPVIFLGNQQIKIIKCSDKNCDNKTDYVYETLKPYSDKFNEVKMKIDGNNKIVLLAKDRTNNLIYWLKCSDENCTTIDKTEYVITGSVLSKDWDLVVNNSGEIEPVFNTGNGLKITDKKGVEYWVGSDGYGIKVNDIKVDQKYGVADYLSIDKLNGEGIGVAYYDALAGDLKYRVFGNGQTCVKSADYDKDGVVNGGDYVIWRREYLDGIAGLKSDGNCDGRVSLTDYSYWRETYLN